MENDNFSTDAQARNSDTGAVQPYVSRDWRDAVTIGIIIGGTALIGIILFFKLQINLGSSSRSNASVQPAKMPYQTKAKTSTLQPAKMPYQAKAKTSTLTRQDAADLISRWLGAKRTVFASPFDRQLAGELTTGAFQKDILKTGGSIDWLKSNNAYYKFGIQKVGNVESISVKGDNASISIAVTEDRASYINGKVDHKQTSYDTTTIRYALKFSDGKWKISDHKMLKIIN